MPSLLRPVDQFMVDASLWVQSMTAVWIAMGVAVAVAVIVVVMARRTQRARARIPQYRRRGSNARVTGYYRDTQR
jgi:hypothetical protein